MNDVLNEQLRNYEGQLQKICDEEAKSTGVVLNEAEIRRVLEEELSFDGEINSALVASILDKVVVKKESTKEEIHLDIYLKMGQRYEAVYAPQKSSASLIRSRSIDARANSLWSTLGEILSSDYSHHVRISYSVMLIV